jgi:hypothetical protein
MAFVKSIRLCGKDKILFCDGNCSKAFGTERPKRIIGDGRIELKPDSDIGITTVPHEEILGEWCLCECERAAIAEIDGGVYESPDL